MKNKNSILKWIILQILFVGTFIPLTKYIYSQGVDPLNFTYQITLVASIILMVYSLFRDRSQFVEIKRKHLLYLLLTGIIGGGLAHSFLATGLNLSSAINCTFIMQTSVFFIPVLSYFFLKEHLRLYKILLIFVLLSGVYLVTTSGKLLTPQFGDLLIIGSSISFSIGIIISKILLKEISVITFAMYRSLFGSMSILIFLIIMDMINPDISWKWVIIMGSVAAIGILTLSKILESSTASYMSMMSMSIPVVTAILAFIFLDEKMTLHQIIGGIIVVFSGIFVHRADV